MVKVSFEAIDYNSRAIIWTFSTIKEKPENHKSNQNSANNYVILFYPAFD